jgi:Ca2+-transporting ATPase
VAVILLLHHEMKWADTIIFCLSLGVSAIPESLPVVLSFTLAVGAQQMALRKALARRLAIVESLGSVDVICTDKTGTLTRNEMTVQSFYTPGHDPYFVTGTGYDPQNGAVQFRHVGRERLNYLIKSMVLCNDARKGGEAGYMGDPTEIALLVAAEKAGLDIADLHRQFPRLDEIPFTSDRKMMTTIHTIQGRRIALVKGASERVLERCTRCWAHGQFRDLDDAMRQEIKDTLTELESQALRVLAAAEREAPEGMPPDEIERELTFLGLAGMIDPPREEVREAVRTAVGAGIRPVMITGDNVGTARAIARQLGMGQNAVTGAELDAMSEEALARRVENMDIIARASPLNKLQILKAIQKNNHFASMTGDGVNDAPALKQADVGVAMGLRGTDAAKEASGLVLLDDNYATIVAAIEEGRRIFDNIRKFVNYLLTCNVGEVLTVLCGVICGLQPLTAIMVLWVNILTDVGPAIALGVDPPNPGMMKRQPRKHDEPILNRGLIWTTVFIGLKKGIENFAVFLVGYYVLARALPSPERLQYAQTMAFTGIVVYAFARIYIIRAFDTIRFFQNPWLIYSLVFAAVVQLFIIYCPDVNDFFGLHILDLKAWIVLGILGVWASTTGVWLSRWVESWAGNVIDTSGVEKSSAGKVRASLAHLKQRQK